MTTDRGRPRRRVRALVLAVASVVLVAGTEAVTATSSSAASGAPLASAPLPYTFPVSGWTLRQIPTGSRPYQSSAVPSFADSKPHDAQGVRKFVQNGRTYDHPEGQAALGLTMLDGYRVTHDARYLTIAVANAKRLIATRVTDTTVVTDGAWFFPYRFPFSLHRILASTVAPPWYSGMAQGQALSLFTRLAEATGDAYWRTAADRTFASFLVPRRVGGPWVVEKLPDGHLWLEEYASPTLRPAPDYTFNGHNFAAYGLYDYSLLSGDERATTLLDGALTSSLAAMPRLRQLGWLSHYCFAHPAITSSGYHRIHASQLLWFHQFTGDARFAAWADLLLADYPTSAVRGTVRLSKGTHVGYRFSATGALLGSVRVVLPRASAAPITARKRWRSRGIWYLVSAGSLRGTWVHEAVPTQYLAGALVVVAYRLPRTLTLAAGSRTPAVTPTSTGVTTRYLTPTDDVTYLVNARGIVDGVPRLRLANGPLAGWWVTVAGARLDGPPIVPPTPNPTAAPTPTG
jgi:hypothetical protein